MFFCSISVAGNPLAGTPAYPTIVSDYRASFARLKKMDADIFFAPHGGQFGMAEKLAKVKPGAPNPFIDAGELQRFAARAEAGFRPGTGQAASRQTLIAVLHVPALGFPGGERICGLHQRGDGTLDAFPCV